MVPASTVTKDVLRPLSIRSKSMNNIEQIFKWILIWQHDQPDSSADWTHVHNKFFLLWNNDLNISIVWSFAWWREIGRNYKYVYLTCGYTLLYECWLWKNSVWVFDQGWFVMVSQTDVCLMFLDSHGYECSRSPLCVIAFGGNAGLLCEVMFESCLFLGWAWLTICWSLWDAWPMYGRVMVTLNCGLLSTCVMRNGFGWLQELKVFYLVVEL